MTTLRTWPAAAVIVALAASLGVAKPRLDRALATGPAACKQEPRFVFDPAGDRHSLPRLVSGPRGYALVGYGGPPSTLHLTTLDLVRRTTRSRSVGTGFLPAVASNGNQLGIAFLDIGANRPRPRARPSPPHEGMNPDLEDQFIVIDGRRAHAPRSNRNQSFFTVIGRDGSTVVKRIPLGDQRVMHTSPGVGVAWNPTAKEWGVIWSEFNLLKFARVDMMGRVRDERRLVVDGFINPHSKLVWTGARYAFVAATSAGHVVIEIDVKGTRELKLPISGTTLEPVLDAMGARRYGVVYRTTRPPPAAAVSPAPPGRPPPAPPQHMPPPPEIHELWFVAITDGVVHKPRLVTTAASGAVFNSPVLATDGGQLVVAWGERRAPSGFDDRLWFARLDAAGTVAAGYPVRLDDEELHQGDASITGTGCELAVSYILGDPNQAVRIGVVRAP